jgi:hypothetical protein
VENGCDNKVTSSLCKDQDDREEGLRARNTHIVHHLQVTSDVMYVKHTKSENNVSDCMTKTLAKPLFEKGLAGMGRLHV